MAEVMRAASPTAPALLPPAKVSLRKSCTSCRDDQSDKVRREIRQRRCDWRHPIGDDPAFHHHD